MSIRKCFLRIEGLGLDSLLARIRNEGFRLYDVQRIRPNAVTFSCETSSFAALKELALARGFAVSVLPPKGLSLKLERIRARRAAVITAAVFFILLVFSLQFVWRIEIIGAGSYIGEVRAYLAQAGIHTGMRRSDIDITTLCDALTWRLPQVAWVRAEHQGLALLIEITQGIPQPGVEDVGTTGNIIAGRDGIIESLSVYAGTPAVKIGDTVKRGDLLISGYEKRESGVTVPVRARGTVKARTYVSESAVLAGSSYRSERTGRSTSRISVCLPYFRFSLTQSPHYLTSEHESSRLAFACPWLPVWFEKETIYEVYLESEAADLSALQTEAGRLAMQKLLLRCGGNDEIIDKWLDYSMIEGGNILAAATAEVLADIALFSPQTPD